MKKTLTVKIEVETDDVVWSKEEGNAYIQDQMVENLLEIAKRVNRGQTHDVMDDGSIDYEGTTQAYQYTITEG